MAKSPAPKKAPEAATKQAHAEEMPKKGAAAEPAKKSSASGKMTAQSAAKAPAKKAATGFNKLLQPDEALAKVVGSKPLPRTEVTKLLWEYIKKHNLQAPDNKRNINADAHLLPVFGGKKQVNMFEMTKLVGGHMK